MWSSYTATEHISVAMDEEKDYLVTGHPILLNRRIYNNDHLNYTIKLLDISCNKEWIAYISTSKSDGETSITRRQFNTTEISDDDQHFSLAISMIDFSEEKVEGKEHCRFLSISPKGDYIALSFFTRNRKAKAPVNPFCWLYKVTSSGIELWKKIKFQGRAVFLHETMALINADFLEVYDIATFKKIHWFDLRTLKPTNSFRGRVEYQKLFIHKLPWVQLVGRDNENDDMRRLIICTRHVRNQVLVTPYKEGVVRVWSMIDGNRLASFRVNEDEHIMAFSNDNKMVTTFTVEALSFNIYDVKSGLVIYTLTSRCRGKHIQLEVSHLRFCFDDQYLVMSGKSEKSVAFEAWHIKSGRSVLFQEVPIKSSDRLAENKYVQPFVAKGSNINVEKCFYGIYTTLENDIAVIKRLELFIHKKPARNSVIIGRNPVPNNEYFKWENDQIAPQFTWELEFENNLKQYEGLKCAHITVVEDKKEYLLRFGKNMVQMWLLHDPDCLESEPISEFDQLLYIRAYSGPKYGFDYSFRDQWEVDTFESIKNIGENSYSRLIVNIKKVREDLRNPESHIEEIFLPISQPSAGEDDILYSHHQIESACQALHYLCDENQMFPSYLTQRTKDQFIHNRDMIYKKTLELTNNTIERMRSKSTFFTTVSGSRTLAMLASFSEGRDIIKKILLYDDIPIRVFSYPRSFYEMIKYTQNSNEDWSAESNEDSIAETNIPLNMVPNLERTFSGNSSPLATEKRKRLSHAVAVNENVLTVLAEESCHLLFRLLFNRVLYDSKEVGIGCLTTMTDTIFFLQSMQRAKGDSFYVLMVNCLEKLTFLSVNPSTLSLLKSELSMYQYKNAFSPKYSSSLIYLGSFSVKEQITKYKSSSILDHIYYILIECVRRIKQYFSQEGLNKKRKREWFANKIKKGKEKWNSYQHGKYSEGPAGLSHLCVVPLIGFNSYQRDYIKPNKRSSVFERMATDTHNSAIFEEGGNVIDILLQNKWKCFARAKFAAMFSIYLVFFVMYIICVSFSGLVFGYSPGTEINSTAQIICTYIMFFFILAIVVQNLRRFVISKSKWNYFTSMFNIFEIITVMIMPILSYFCMIYDWPYRKEGISTCTLVLWFHAILKLRIFPFIGVTLETIIQLWRSVAPVFAVTLLVISGFTNAFMVLLYEEKHSYFQEKFIQPSISNDTTALQDSSQSNQFQNAFKAFYTVWFFMYGVWDPAIDGDAGDNVMIMILSTLFTFFTVLIFFNLTIARMSGAVERVTKLGDKVWITHFAAVLSEIELLWCSKRKRQSRKSNPEFLFYNANAVLIQKHGLKLREETDKLKDALLLKLEFVKDFGTEDE